MNNIFTTTSVALQRLSAHHDVTARHSPIVKAGPVVGTVICEEGMKCHDSLFPIDYAS